LQFKNFAGSYDKCAAALRDRYKDDMAAVTSTIFSHTQVAKKNMLVTMLIDHLWSNEPGLTDELAATLNELTSLNRSEHSRVALRARQVSVFVIIININSSWLFFSFYKLFISFDH